VHAKAIVSSDFYQHPDLYDALLPAGVHLPFYSELARRHPAGVLELACGTGQLAVPIAGLANRVVGLDRSTAMLASARARAAEVGAACTFVEGDMRRFDLAQKFDLIFVARNSLLHLLKTEDLVSALTTVRAHLAPGGVFAFDVFNPSPVILARPQERRFPVMERTSSDFGPLVVEGTHRYEADQQVDYGTWYVSSGEERDKWIVSVVVRSIFPQELPLLLRSAGLELVHRFGDFSRHPFGSDSPHQVCVCRATTWNATTV
jgi:SAM-dependent methyltransferase